MKLFASLLLGSLPSIARAQDDRPTVTCYACSVYQNADTGKVYAGDARCARDPAGLVADHPNGNTMTVHKDSQFESSSDGKLHTIRRKCGWAEYIGIDHWEDSHGVHEYKIRTFKRFVFEAWHKDLEEYEGNLHHAENIWLCGNKNTKCQMPVGDFELLGERPQLDMADEDDKAKCPRCDHIEVLEEDGSYYRIWGTPACKTMENYHWGEPPCNHIGGRSTVPGIMDSGPLAATESEYFRNTRGEVNALSKLSKPYAHGTSGICNTRQANYWMDGKKATPFARMINRHCDFWDRADGIFDGYYSISSEYGDLMVCNNDLCNNPPQGTGSGSSNTYSVMGMLLVLAKSFF